MTRGIGLPRRTCRRCRRPSLALGAAILAIPMHAVAIHTVSVVAPMIVALAPVGHAIAQPAAPGAGTGLPAPSRDARPYDDKLMRLAEILGAIHYLRELCSGGDGQMWRERMEELIRAEGPSALRQARLTRTFNQGYRTYERTYPTCTPTAKTTIERFVTEGAQLSETLLKAIQ